MAANTLRLLFLVATNVNNFSDLKKSLIFIKYPLKLVLFLNM